MYPARRFARGMSYAIELKCRGSIGIPIRASRGYRSRMENEFRKDTENEFHTGELESPLALEGSGGRGASNR